MFSISANLGYVIEGSLDDKMAALANAGFTHVSLSSGTIKRLGRAGYAETASFCALLKRHRLAVDWVHAPIRLIKLYARDPDLWTMVVDALKKAMDDAMRLGARSIIVHAIDQEYPGEESPEYCAGRITEAYGVLTEYASTAGLVVATENLPFSSSIPLVTQLLNTLPELGLCLDTGHAQITHSWDLLLQGYAHRIVAMHIHDNHGETDEHMVPGDGTIDLERHLGDLRVAGYRGVWGVECLQMTTHYAGDANDVAHRIYRNMTRILEPVASSIESCSSRLQSAR